jgi:hypothetical protein
MASVNDEKFCTSTLAAHSVSSTMCPVYTHS